MVFLISSLNLSKFAVFSTSILLTLSLESSPNTGDIIGLFLNLVVGFSIFSVFTILVAGFNIGSLISTFISLTSTSGFSSFTVISKNSSSRVLISFVLYKASNYCIEIGSLPSSLY